MYEWTVLVLLGIVQGITEWMPVSSSTHLALVSSFFNTPPSRSLEVALHLGTLMAVFVYFGKDILDSARDILSGRFSTPSARVGLLVLLASVPAGILGFLLQDTLSVFTGSFGFAGGGLLITSLLLFLGARAPRRTKELDWKGALLIGSMQVFSLLRGISRSGSTLVPGLWLGLHERDAIRFSFLLSIPIILGASFVTLGGETLPPSLFMATLVSFGVGMGSIHFFFTKVLCDRRNLRWFAWYTGLLGLSILMWQLFV